MADKRRASLKSKLAESIAVLVIGDCEAAIEFLADLLREKRLVVILTSTGQTGLSVWAECREEIDLVILDHSLPDMTGAKIFKVLKMVKPNVKVIVTAASEIDQADYGGAKLFLSKEVIQDDLTAIKMSIRGILDNHS